MLGAAWVTRDLPARPSRSAFSPRVTRSRLRPVPRHRGLLAGLYRSRYQRGSLDEVVGVGTAAFGTCACARRADHVRWSPASRRRWRPWPARPCSRCSPCSAPVTCCSRSGSASGHPRRPQAAMKVIVFGAGDGGHPVGAQPADRTRTPSTGRWRMLDDDPDKRRLRIFGVPVLGDRTAMAQAAARTGATVLVIAIARASGTAIRDLTAAGGAVRPGAQGGADGRANCSAAASASRACAIRGSATCSAAGRCRPTSPRSPGTSPASGSWSPGPAAPSGPSSAASCTSSARPS